MDAFPRFTTQDGIGGMWYCLIPIFIPLDLMFLSLHDKGMPGKSQERTRCGLLHVRNCYRHPVLSITLVCIMILLRSFARAVLPVSVFLCEANAALHPFRHEAIEVRRRQASSSDDALTQSSTAGSVLTFVTPSPGAAAVPVTKQSQLVSSNVPVFTLCALPPEAFFPVTATPTQTTAPYRNYSISIPPGPGTCTTIYSPTVTMVCATVLTGIDRMYRVTQCGQDITFSSDYGYVLATPSPALSTPTDTSGTAALITPAPTIQKLTTYYVAPWQELTSAGPPTNVDRKICAIYANGTEECVVEYYLWKTSLVTMPTSTVTSINLTTTIAGPSQLVVETFVANITEILTTFSMSTTMELTYSVETETTNITTRPIASTGPTITQTYTVSPAQPSTM